MSYIKIYNIMSVREIFGDDWKINPEYLPPTTTPELFSKQILTGDANGDYVVVGGTQAAGTVLAATTTGLAWQASPTISLQRGGLITSDGTNVVELQPPTPLSAASDFRLVIDNSTATGLKWEALSQSVQVNPPLDVAATVGNPGGVDITLGYGVNGRGQLPVGNNSANGGVGNMLNPGTDGQILTCRSSNVPYGLRWENATTSTVTAAANSNITVTIPSTNSYAVAMRSPLNANINLGTQSISGTLGTIQLTDVPNNQRATHAADLFNVQNYATPAINSLMTSTEVAVSTATNQTSFKNDRIEKLLGTDPLLISHTISNGPIQLQTAGGTSDVATNCALKPAKIRDSANSLGTANQVLSCGPSGADVRWISPVVPTTPTLAQVITAGATNNTGININMNGNSTITNLTSPSANSDASTKSYVDTRTLANVLAAGNVANAKITSLTTPTDANDAANKSYVDTAVTGVTRTLAQVCAAGNVANSKITSLTTPTDANDAANKSYVDTSITSALTPYTVKSLTAGSNVTVSNASGNWTISAAGTGGPLSNVNQPTNKTVSYNTSTNVLATTTGTSVSIFPNIGARDVALTSPFVGELCFITENNVLQFWNMDWFNYSPLVDVRVNGFTFGTDYDVTYVDALNAVVAEPAIGGFTVVRFYPTSTQSGTILLSKTAVITYLVVAGGGGGGGGGISSSSGGAGGAGGYLSSVDAMYASTAYAIQVGGGGTKGSVGSQGQNGDNSTLAVQTGTITAIGGGRGGTLAPAGNGGSGGGGGAVISSPPGAGGAGTAGQGNSGSQGNAVGGAAAGGCGGGAGAAGTSGSGGIGVLNTIRGNPGIYYAGGGGGGFNDGAPQVGGNGGGGNGGYNGSVNGVDGVNGLGGGGGGGSYDSLSSTDGGNGGSGVVIVRFPSFIF